MQMLDMRASVNEWQANKNQEARVTELEHEVAMLRERVVDSDNYCYALQKLNARIRDAVEEGQARFEDSLVSEWMCVSPAMEEYSRPG
jgi:hypothetical protein